MPSNTGQPGGKRTGQQMTHYILEDGPFAEAPVRGPGWTVLGWLLDMDQYWGRALQRVCLDRFTEGHSWTWTSAGEGHSKGYAWTSAGEGHAGKVCLPRMQSRGMGQTRAAPSMRGLPRAYGLSPESHTQAF